MKVKNFYPLLEEFLKGRHYINEALEKEEIRKIKLDEQDEIVSPFSGNVINMKKLMYDIEKAKASIIAQSELYGPYVHDMTPTIYTWVVETACTDGVRLFVNPEFMNNLSHLEKIFVIVHEIMHCVLLHDRRIGNRDPFIFNLAADYEVNGILVNADDFTDDFVANKMKALYNPEFINLAVEYIYERIKDNPPKTKPPEGPGPGGLPPQGPGKGRGKGPGGYPGGGGVPIDDIDDIDDIEEIEELTENQKSLRKELKKYKGGEGGGLIPKHLGEEIAKEEGYSDEEGRIGEDNKKLWEKNAKELFHNAMKKLAGSGKGDYLIKILGKNIRATKNWKQLLKDFVGMALSYAEKEWALFSKKRMERTSKTDIYYRRLKPSKNMLEKCFIAVDVSGSMFVTVKKDIRVVDIAMAEIFNILKDFKVKETTLIFFDDGVDDKATTTLRTDRPIHLPNLDKIKASGGGGTDFQKPLDYIKEKFKDNVKLLIFLTDGYANVPEVPKYSKKFVWVIYNNVTFKCPWGRIVYVTQDEMSQAVE